MARTSNNRTAQLVLSMDPDTKERLRAYAEQNHTTMSQAVTDWIWKLPVTRADRAGPGSAAPPELQPGAGTPEKIGGMT